MRRSELSSTGQSFFYPGWSRIRQYMETHMADKQNIYYSTNHKPVKFRKKDK